MKRTIIILIAALGVSGCASIVKGTSQNVAVNTNPQGARCELTRDGKNLGVVEPTPGTVKISKSKNDVEIACTLKEHKPAKYILESGTEVMTVGNVIFGGLIGIAVDAGSGAMNKYDGNITVVMQKDEKAVTE